MTDRQTVTQFENGRAVHPPTRSVHPSRCPHTHARASADRPTGRPTACVIDHPSFPCTHTNANANAQLHEHEHEHEQGELARIREVYERAIAQVPPVREKRSVQHSTTLPFFAPSLDPIMPCGWVGGCRVPLY